MVLAFKKKQNKTKHKIFITSKAGTFMICVCQLKHGQCFITVAELKVSFSFNRVKIREIVISWL